MSGTIRRFAIPALVVATAVLVVLGSEQGRALPKTLSALRTPQATY